MGEKQNELSIVGDFLTPALLKGRIITSDALHTQHAFCRGVDHAGPSPPLTRGEERLIGRSERDRVRRVERDRPAGVLTGT